MSLKGLKNILVGQPEPDMSDPKVKARAEQTQAAGRKFAKVTGISKATNGLQNWANGHKKLFLGIVFAFVIVSAILNIARLTRIGQYRRQKFNASQIQDSLRRQKKAEHERKTIQMPTSAQPGEVDGMTGGRP